MTLRDRIDTFLLRDAERAARERPVERATLVAERCATASAHLEAARSLARPRTAASSALVYRAAIDAFLAAHAALDEKEVVPRKDAAAVRGVDASLLDAAAAVLDSSEPPASRASLNAADAVAVALAARIDPRSPSAIRRARRVRVVLVACSFVAAIVLVVSWAEAPHDLARGKHVTASSVRKGDPAALVDGSIQWGRFALHTNRETLAWVAIDLGASRPLVEVRVYNRGDGFFDDATGARVEVSDDGKVYRPAGVCRELFTQVNPCRIPMRGTRARFVRVAKSGVLVLSEVEVLGT